MSESRILQKRLGLARKRKTVLFICTGDTCRNPMVAGYLRKLLELNNIRDLEIRTAGVMTVNGLLPSDESLEMLREEDIEYSSHRSRPLTPELIRRAHLILGMTPIHVQTALRLDEDAKGKTFLLREYTGTADGKNSQINDPMGCTLEVYKNCFKLIRRACDQLIKKEFFRDLLPRKREEETKADPAPKPAARSKKSTRKSTAGKSSAAKKAAGTKGTVKKSASRPARKAVKKAAKKTATKKAAAKSQSATRKKTARKKSTR